MGDRTSATVAGPRKDGLGRDALFQKLKPGPGRSPDQVVANQRARLHGAMIELVAEQGYRRVTVRALSRLAGVSTKSFYECFANVENCFVATYALILRDAISPPAEVPPTAEERMRVRLDRFFRAFDGDPKAAGLLLVDAPSAGPALVARTGVANKALERFLAEVLGEISSGPPPRPLIRGTAAAALQLARSRLRSDETVPTSVIASQFADWLLCLCSDHLPGGSLELSTAIYDEILEAVPSGGLVDDRHFLLAAVTKLCVRGGYASLTIPAICREAGVSRRSFDNCFGGVSECFLAAVDLKIATVVSRAETEAAGRGDWGRGVVRATAVLCAELQRDRALAQLALVDILAPGGPGLELRDQVLARWAHRLCQTPPQGVRLEKLATEASIAAALAIAALGNRRRADTTAAHAAFVVLAPAVGAESAAEIIASELHTKPPT